jgi:hypothetical protein
MTMIHWLSLPKCKLNDKFAWPRYFCFALYKILSEEKLHIFKAIRIHHSKTLHEVTLKALPPPYFVFQPSTGKFRKNIGHLVQKVKATHAFTNTQREDDDFINMFSLKREE